MPIINEDTIEHAKHHLCFVQYFLGVAVKDVQNIENEKEEGEKADSTADIFSSEDEDEEGEEEKKDNKEEMNFKSIYTIYYQPICYYMPLMPFIFTKIFFFFVRSFQLRWMRIIQLKKVLNPKNAAKI